MEEEEGVEMEMEVEMAEEEEGEVFVVREIDPDYEYDAPQHFDFSREESAAEARDAELWFESAGSYPPSPFVVKLILRDEILSKNVNISPKSKMMETDSHVRFGEIDAGTEELEAVQPNSKGLRSYNHISCNTIKAKSRTSVKPCLPRSSTLMKPTASMLAKQNQPSQVASSRFQVQTSQISGKSLGGSSAGEGQATKRQKLDGGHSRKVGEVKQQTDFVHKAPKKDAIVEKNPHSKLRLTIPREPELETAQRAQRARPRNTSDEEQSTVTVRKFKARPLNRKIFEAPSLPLPKKSIPRMPEFQVFHLKTLERAMEHNLGATSSLLHESDKELLKSCPVAEKEPRSPRRTTGVDASRLDGTCSMYAFKAHPLNKKILSSKGDIGVFRNKKREATVPMEFKFNNEKRIQHNPPTELFSKLSLKPELQPSNGSYSQRKSCQPPRVSMKGPKENRFHTLQQNLEVTNLVKERTPFGEKQSQYGNGIATTEAGTRFSARSLGIR
ncbi:protein TPX2 isoform X2 [Syzygium oleosum]|uniref:protein TPX2 isoform X2 n=1 Tax=Syzygium oleosum TaxID=219896 RepID=UPI0024BAC70D|nr:protein TPX2 isoform X2 [Syzygium oleosum]